MDAPSNTYGTKPATIAAFEPFSSPLEGRRLPYMYADVEGLVSGVTGNLFDTSRLVKRGDGSYYSDAGGTIMTDALALPWRRYSDISIASKADVQAAFDWAKAHTATPGQPGASNPALDYSQKGGGNWKTIMTGGADAVGNKLAVPVFLDDDAMSQLIASKFFTNAKILATRFPAYPSYPVDGQLLLHSMSWALGAGFKYPKFQAFINAVPADWSSAAAEAYMPDSHNPGLVPRNALNKQLAMNAASVLSQNLDPDKLYLPLPNPGEGRDAWVARATAGSNTGITGGGTSGEPPPFYEHVKAEMSKDKQAPKTGMSTTAKVGIVAGFGLAVVAAVAASKR